MMYVKGKRNNTNRQNEKGEIPQIELYSVLGDWDIASPTSVYIGTYPSEKIAEKIACDIVEKMFGQKIYYLEYTLIDDTTKIIDYGSHSRFFATHIKSALSNSYKSFFEKMQLKAQDARINKIDEVNLTEIMWNELKYGEYATDELYDIMEEIEDKYNYKDCTTE